MSRWIFRVIVSAAVLAVLLALIPIGAVVDALTRVSPWVWTASLVIFFAGHAANAFKLQLLLGAAPPPAGAMMQAQYAGLAANLGLPGLAGGDLVRAAYLAPAVGVKRVALASLADRVIDSATLLVLVAVALPLAGMPPAIEAVLRPGGWWVAGVAAVLAVAVAVPFVAARGTSAGAKIQSAIREVAARRSSIAAAAAISLAVQAAFVMTNVWLARQAGVEAGLAAWFVAWPLSKLIAVLPISLGGLGVREAALVSLLAPYGADGTAVLASGLLWQAVLAVSGLVGLAVTQLLRRRVAVA
jgi:uncharacterized membrane protein YbhN (UPF0104 family)